MTPGVFDNGIYITKSATVNDTVEFTCMESDPLVSCMFNGKALLETNRFVLCFARRFKGGISLVRMWVCTPARMSQFLSALFL